MTVRVRSWASPRTGQHEETSRSPPFACAAGLGCASFGLQRPAGTRGPAPCAARWAPSTKRRNAEVQCTAVLKDLMVPEVGVEIPPQLVDLQCPAAGLRLKVPPGHTPAGLRHACAIPPAQMVSAALVHATTPRIAARGPPRSLHGACASSSRTTSRITLAVKGRSYSVSPARSASLMRVW